jgi:DNA-binding MarR family transcriptional regulator
MAKDTHQDEDAAATTIGEAFEELLAATHQLEFAVSAADAFGNKKVSYSDIYLLRSLQSGGEQQISHLARALRVSRQRLNRTIRQMVKKEFIGQKSGEEDARVKLISILPAGEEVLNASRKQLHEFAEKLTQPAPTLEGLNRAAGVARRLSAAAWKVRKASRAKEGEGKKGANQGANKEARKAARLETRAAKKAAKAAA